MENDAMLRAMMAAHVAAGLVTNLGGHQVQAIASQAFEIADALMEEHRKRVLADEKLRPRDQWGRDI